MDSNIFYQRRQKLLKLCEDGSLLLLFANDDKGISFIQDKNFFYLTGLNIPAAVLTISKVQDKLHTNLFIERTIPERIVWDGEKMSREEAKQISGIEKIHYLDRLEPGLSDFLANSTINQISKIYLENGSLSINDPLTKPLQYAQRIRERYPAIKFDSLSKLLNPMRMVKDKWEIDQIQKAVNITGEGLLSILKSKIAGKYEYQIEALLHYVFVDNNVRTWGFKPIVASGKNAATLHYCQNNCKISGKDLLLLDVGALYNNYCADITRTFPAGKKFNQRQKAVYNEVLQVQKEIIKLVKPGITLKMLNEKTVELITEALFRLKLIKEKGEFRKYYMHSVSHYLGMEAHDVYTFGAGLEKGNVITVEPGIYIPEEGIGVRIEDDVLVTGKGFKVLSADIPKEIDEIESIRSGVREK